jgi:Tol biopolymer transport system component/DNA-binding winged helix-turn-helix (wHTH) protein
MERINADVFEFGEFRLDPAERVLRRNGAVVSLTPKAVSMLELLVRGDGTVVSRSEMIEALWPDTFVEEANLTVTISMLRKALGESFIRTIPKRGYAFAVPVRRFEPHSSNGKHAAAPFEAASIQSSVVSIPTTGERRRLLLPILLTVLALTIAVAAWSVRRDRTSNQHANPRAFAAMTLTRLSDAGNIRDVTISPDGKRLAFVSIQAGREGLRIRNLETNEPVQLLEPQERLCWGLRFAHDGKSLYYNTTEPNSTISVLYRIDARGGEPPRKISVNIDSPISLSPDGSQIAFVRSFPGKHYDALVIANNDGTGEHELSTLQHPQKFSFSGSAWSPDGATIAVGVSGNNGVTFTIQTVPLLGGKPRVLTDQPWSGLRGFAWSDNGRDLFFVAGTRESPATQLWRVESSTGAVARITNDLNYYDGVHLTKDGSRIVTMQVAEIINLWVVDPPVSAGARKLTFGTKEGAGGVVALPNGQVVYTIEENGKLNLWTVNRDGGGATQLTTAGAAFPAVTPDGKYLVYSSLRTGVRHIYRLDLSTREEVQLTNNGGENFPSCSPDGRWVVYTALAGDRNTLWRVSLDGGPPEQLTQGSISMKPVVSPDGKSIACAFRKDDADKWKIAILPFAGGEPLQVLNIPKPFNQILRWTPDSKALFYVVEKNGATNIWKQSLDGSPPEQVTQFTDDEMYSYDRFGAGDSFLLARGRTMRDIVLIRNP